MKTELPSDDRSQRLVARAREAELGPAAGASARVWARLEKRRSRTRRLAWPMFIAGAASAAVLAVVLWRAPVPKTIAFVTSGPAPRALAIGEQLHVGVSPAMVDVVNTARLSAGAGASLRVTEAGPSIALTLDEGTALVHVRPRAGRAPFLVRTPGFSARVVGTVFRINVAATGESSIVVARGQVEVLPVAATGSGLLTARPVLVHAGERWPLGHTDAASSDELARLGTAELEGATLADFAPPALPCAGPPEAALSCQLAQAEHHSPLSAENALYEAGWIALRELHDPARALGIWKNLRTRFPNGPLRTDVDASVVDALVAQHRSAEALGEIDSYLRTYPDGLRAAEMHFVRATLLEEHDGDCRRARHELDLALQRPAAPWAASATRARTACDRR